jgi:hypothetical protein
MHIISHHPQTDKKRHACMGTDGAFDRAVRAEIQTIQAAGAFRRQTSGLRSQEGCGQTGYAPEKGATTMATSGPTPQPADYERQALSELDAASRQIHDYLAALHRILRPLTPEEATAVVNYLQACEQNCQSYEPLAQYLAQSGLPRLSQRLAQERTDLGNAGRIYSGISQDAVRSRTQMAQWAVQTQSQINADTFATFQAMNAHNQEIRAEIERRGILIDQGCPYWLADALSRRTW